MNMLRTFVLMLTAIAGATLIPDAAWAQTAPTSPTTSTFVTAPPLPSISNSLSLVQQSQDALGQLEQNVLGTQGLHREHEH